MRTQVGTGSWAPTLGLGGVRKSVLLTGALAHDGSPGAGPFVHDLRALSNLASAPASCHQAEHDPAPTALPSGSHCSACKQGPDGYGNFTGSQVRRGWGTSWGGMALGERRVFHVFHVPRPRCSKGLTKKRGGAAGNPLSGVPLESPPYIPQWDSGPGEHASLELLSEGGLDTLAVPF